MFKGYGVIGLVSILIAFLLNFFKIIPAYPIGLIVPHYFFLIGLWLILDAIDFMMNKSSVLHKIKKWNILFFYIFLSGILIGVIFEFYGIFISNLWTSYFNTWSLQMQILHYSVGIIVGYGIPVLIYMSLFRISLTLTKKEFGKFGKRLITKRLESNLFRNLGTAGLIFLIIPLLLYPFSLYWSPILRGWLFSFCLIGLWFVLEYVEYRRHESSFLKDIFEGKWLPPLAVIITALIVPILWENLNYMRESWAYRNIPLENFKIFGIPVVIMGGWVLLVVIYLSFFRIILKKRERIW